MKTIKTRPNQVFVLLLLTTILLSCEQKRVKVGYLEELNLKGDVFQVIEHTYYGEGSINDYQILDIQRRNKYFPHKLYEFNDEGFLILDCELDRDGNKNDCFTRKLDGNSIVIESNQKWLETNDTKEILLREDGSRADYVEKTNNGNTEEYTQNGNMDIHRFINDYDEYTIEKHLNRKGKNIFEYWINSSGGKSKNREIEYNSNGDISNVKYFSGEKDTLRRMDVHLYKYDDYKNWTEHVIFRDGEFYVAVKRRIGYFKECFKEFKRADFVGMWKKQQTGDWIEFFEDGKLDIGYGSSISKSGTWEIDNKAKRVTFRIDGAGTKLDYDFSKCSLTLVNPINKKYYDVYNKVTD